jgi:hypothetical protein
VAVGIGPTQKKSGVLQTLAFTNRRAPPKHSVVKDRVLDLAFANQLVVGVGTPGFEPRTQSPKLCVFPTKLYPNIVTRNAESRLGIFSLPASLI